MVAQRKLLCFFCIEYLSQSNANIPLMARKLNCSVGPSILVRSQYHLAVPVLASVSISAGPQHCIVLPNLHHITLYCIAQPVSCFIVLYCPTCICCRGLWANWIWPLAICARGLCARGKFCDQATAFQEYETTKIKVEMKRYLPKYK